MVIQSLREGSGISLMLRSLTDLRGPGASAAVQLPAALVLEALRQDGTLAAVELMDGRPVAMMPFWIEVR